MPLTRAEQKEMVVRKMTKPDAQGSDVRAWKGEGASETESEAVWQELVTVRRVRIRSLEAMMRAGRAWMCFKQNMWRE